MEPDLASAREGEGLQLTARMFSLIKFFFVIRLRLDIIDYTVTETLNWNSAGAGLEIFRDGDLTLDLAWSYFDFW